ncbi:MAG: hypothetical protein COW84_06460 [Gammaproteobacteria bacterium CG22_combo_CG10-13_8_21_14_all_40_8]|nr:MAG: hypothetical protein COW84_06460 [Gammaproteobacteria bacterium CG22_combo_CG10-13_8_21_14_all_40_8]
MHQQMIDAVKYWVEHTVIGFNFCPFAKREFDKGSIRYEVIDSKNVSEQLLGLLNELKRLDQDETIETTLLIFPVGLEGILDYLDYLEEANNLLMDRGYEGIYQLASFHPDYCFQGNKDNDPSNYTNRSPYPMLHIIRERSLERALAKFAHPELIPERNIQLARDKGVQVFEDILTQAKRLKSKF